MKCADCTIDNCSGASANHSGSSDGLDGVTPDRLFQKPNWLNADFVLSYTSVGSEQDTAQCNPYLFTAAIFEAASSAGVKMVTGSALNIEKTDVAGSKLLVEYAEKARTGSRTLLATDVVVAAGPWSSTILPEVSVSGARCHSIVLRPQKSLSNDLLFMDIAYMRKGEKRHLTPELYPRPDGTVYACEAANATFPLPRSTADTVVAPEECDEIREAVAATSCSLVDASYETRQVCYQPIVVWEGKRRKLVGPFLGRASIPGAYLACGHDSWGISNAPATGKALTELIFDGESVSVEINSLSVLNTMARARELKQ